MLFRSFDELRGGSILEEMDHPLAHLRHDRKDLFIPEAVQIGAKAYKVIGAGG